ncbi:MAG: VOC family protein [Alphaproteobacteria bacterium]|nr:VOC family protein [Alphaproteobacteria bacterium]
MKRMHIHVGVKNLAESIRFYSALFGAQPVKTKPDYAKWMLEDPRLNFAISTRAAHVGVDHLGIQVDDGAELSALRDQLAKANLATHSDGETTCCYAKSEKSWVEDPSGIAWETYHTMEDAQIFSPAEAEGACCSPETKGTTGCCTPSERTTGCC